MMELFYDFHMHSCLSPCAEEDMTPGNICGMAKLAGLGIIALTDHNTCGNARVFCGRAAEMGLVGIPGMELTVQEEVHVVCLFPDVDSAERFSGYVYTRLPEEDNHAWLFGRQVYIGPDDEPSGHEPRLLMSAADIGIYDVAKLAESYGGLAFPAHIDRNSLSLLSNLGLWDDGMDFRLCEYRTPPEGTHPIDARHPRKEPAAPLGAGRPVPYVTGSDAHQLSSIQDGRYALSIAEPTPQAVLDALKKL